MQKPLIADICLLLVALVWGATFVLVQNAISFLEPLSFNSVRFSLAAALLGSWLLLFERKQLRMCNGKLLFAGTLLGVLLFVGYAFQTLGLLSTTSSKAGFITGLSVVMVPLFSIVFLKIKLGINAITGVAVAAVGLYFLTMTDSAPLTIGDGLIFICAIGFALHIVTTGKFTGEFPALALTVVQLATVALLSAAGAFFFEDWNKAFQLDILLTGQVLSALIVTALFATALAYYAQTAFQKHTTPTRVALIFAMEPVFAAITAFIWAHERLSISAIMGCLLIFAGMIFAELPSGWSIFKRGHKQDLLAKKM
ncbi:DMT family transporter [Mesobacillus harenae]|uniref:DMT family transporter n=1 Tax=Mesobacillus harenae TaxID=2213203 RepID=UPI001580B394|nr:DMT family transporter [Mesobacillus harenae]